MKKNELTIEIPDNKVVDWDESKKQNKIVLKDKQLTYEDVCDRLPDMIDIPLFDTPSEDGNALVANEHQLECILAKNKLANVAVYLNGNWKPKQKDCVYGLILDGGSKDVLIPIYMWNTKNCTAPMFVFKSIELAQQAIKILGEETVKLALEPLGICRNMIKEVMIYETTDGCRFDTEKEAKEYEALYEKCEKTMSQLRPHENYGAVQQDVELAKKAFNEFMDLCVEVIPKYKKTFIGVKEGNIHPSWAQRIISDYNIKCLLHAFFRFSCTNMVSGIEYEQPYFVEHESEWKREII